jgi:hypothetical protein
VGPRTRLLLDAPILPTLLWLAIPNVLTTLVQAATGVAGPDIGADQRHQRSTEAERQWHQRRQAR